MYQRLADGPICMSESLKEQVQRGLDSDDDFDAVVGLLAMLRS